MTKVLDKVAVYERKDRPGTWTYVTKVIGGKKRSFKSRDEATKAMVEAVDNFNNGLVVVDVSSPIVTECADRFLADQKESFMDGDISLGHFDEIKRSIKFCLTIKIDGKPMAKHKIDVLMQMKIRAEVGRSLMRGIKAEGKSKATCEKRVKFLKMMFNYSITKGWGSVNPLDKMSLGMSSDISDRAPRIQPENIQRLIAIGLEGETLLTKSMVLTAIASGIRQGELRALMWSNVDLESATVKVEQAVKHGNTSQIKEPKTKRGFRTIPIPVEVVALLRELKMASKFSADDDFVFANQNGNVQLKKKFPNIMKWICNRADVPLMLWGDFRHFFASVQISELGEDWGEVAQLMGHANTAFTYRQYGHYVKNKEKQAQVSAATSKAMFG